MTIDNTCVVFQWSSLLMIHGIKFCSLNQHKATHKLYSSTSKEVKLADCNRLRSWTFLLRVIGPQLPKQRRFRHFQLPSIFPPRVHAVITRWSCSPPQCTTNQQEGVTCAFPPNQSANRVMFSANQYLTCNAVFMRPHPKFHRSN